MRDHQAGQPEVSFTDPLANIIRKRSQRTNDRETWSCYDEIQQRSLYRVCSEVVLPVAMVYPVGQAILVLLGRPVRLFQEARCPTENA